jgi:hypothetical protein
MYALKQAQQLRIGDAVRFELAKKKKKKILFERIFVQSKCFKG